MKLPTALSSATVTFAALAACALPAGNANAALRATPCAALAGLSIPSRVLGLPTSGGRVTSTRTVPASGSGAAAVGEHCQVDAALFPVDPRAPDILMSVALPTAWNGKALMFGGGGYDGFIPPATTNVPFGSADAATPLGRGYAVFGSDSGHQPKPGSISVVDGSFGVNDEAVQNFAGDALKKTRDAAMFIIATRYGEQPWRTYFAGGSSGGREGLAVAQRWPRDFDGVISASPAWNAASLNLWFGYMAQVLQRPGAFPNAAKQQLVHTRVMRTCDGKDGLRDGIVSDEAGCGFDPKVLRCPGGTDLGSHCLSDAQINAFEDLSSPVEWGYRPTSGERGYPGLAFLSGANPSTPGFSLGTRPPAQPLDPFDNFAVYFWDQWVKYFVTRDPDFDSLTLDPRKPGKWKKRISYLTGLQDVDDPDLRPFAKAGGKLLIVHGTADPVVSHRSTAEYHQRVRAVVGTRATARFIRLYTMAGTGHGGFSPFEAGWDSLTALEQWSEKGRAPKNPIATDTNTATFGRTRPLCEYPAWPKYKGTGDPDRADSFTCHH